MSGSNYTLLCATALVKNISHCRDFVAKYTRSYRGAAAYSYTFCAVANSLFHFLAPSASHRRGTEPGPPGPHEYGWWMSYEKKKNNATASVPDARELSCFQFNQAKGFLYRESLPITAKFHTSLFPLPLEKKTIPRAITIVETFHCDRE